MLRKKSVVLLALGVLTLTLFGCVQTANAQVLFGSASGTVTDQSGAAVSKAHVASVNKATGVRKETDADASGFYTLTDLPPGLYDITVSAGGFKPLTQTGVNIGANVVTNTNFNLQVGSVSEKVTVEAEGVTLPNRKNRRSHGDSFESNPGDAAQSVSELSDTDQFGAGSYARTIPERHCGFAGARSEHQHQRHEPQQQQYARGWRC